MLVATIAFPILLAAAVYLEELSWPQVFRWVFAAAVGFCIVTLVRWPSLAFGAYMTLIDAILVLIVFKRDIEVPSHEGLGL